MDDTDAYTDDELRALLTAVMAAIHGEVTAEAEQRIEEALQRRSWRKEPG